MSTLCSELLTSYKRGLIDVLGSIASDDLAAVIDQLAQARSTTRSPIRRRVFVCGNGGSAATAGHFACDLSKNAGGFSAIALTDHIATTTALANDEGYDQIFGTMLRLLASPGDVLVAISVSGNSPNVVDALRVALGLGISTIGLLGMDGGEACPFCEHRLLVPFYSYEMVEDAHLAICHMITRYFKEDRQ